MREEEFRSGFIAILGCPNVGKSTLMNRMVGQKVSIVSDRAQTTRNRIMGVVHRKAGQMVFLDTPGVTTPKNRLGEYMQKVAYDSLDEVEAVLFVTDALQGIREKDEALIARLRSAKAPVVAAVNKIDRASLDDVARIQERLAAEPFVKSVHKVSAREGTGVEALLAALDGYLVPGPRYFPEDMVTDQPERVLCAEIIREKALLLLQEEVPHGLGVDVEKMALREPDGLCDVWATLYCERDSHKPILIGKKGAMLKAVGSEARKDMEWLLGTRVNLQLWVKVRENWRNSPSALRQLGYE